MATVTQFITEGASITLDATDEFTPNTGVFDTACIAVAGLVFSADWNGTLTFQGAHKTVAGDGTVTMNWDPHLTTNLVDGTTGSTTTGGASATEHWRGDLSGTDGFRVYATLVTTGSVAVTLKVVMG